MSNVFTRFFCPGTAAKENFATEMNELQEEINNMGQSLESPLRAPCADCKGIFEGDGLVPVQRITIDLDDEVRVTRTLYCQKCKPPTPFELILEDKDGDCLDSMVFRVDDGYFQPVNDETGEEKILTSLEEYSHLVCTECGTESDWTLCKPCTRRLKKS